MGVVEDAGRGGISLGPWGKFDSATGESYALLFHLLDAGAVGEVLWRWFLTARQRRLIADGLGVPLKQAGQLVAFFAACHDIGKASAFQACEPVAWARVGEALRADAGGWVWMPHGRASMVALLPVLVELGFEVAGNESAGVRVAQVAGGHHGGYLALDVAGELKQDGRLGGPLWADLRRRYVLVVHHLLGVDAVPSRMSAQAAVLITGVVMLADRLVSQRGYWTRRASAPAVGAAEHMAGSRAQAPRLVDRAGLTRVVLPEMPFARAHGLPEPNAMQASLMTGLGQAGLGGRGAIVLVTDGTGGGKSAAGLEAARLLNAACGTAGWCWLLPTTATADAAYDVAARYVEAHGADRSPLGLVHHHPWLNRAYTDQRIAADLHGSTRDAPWNDTVWDEGDGEERERPREAVTVPDRWLRGWDRALLAQFTVATVDQALMAALPVRHSPLRMLALSGKTVIIDEAHVLDTFTFRQLERLLVWLGGFGTPVVVLSATLPSRAGERLVAAYLRGAGTATQAGPLVAPYPGWLIADAGTGATVVMAAADRERHRGRQRRSVMIGRADVVYRPLGPLPRQVQAGERLAVIGELVAPVAAGGGYAAVMAATVTDAQETYRYLRDTLDFGGQPADLVLLHARFPGRQRERLMRRVRQALGRNRPYPGRMVVVTTSVLDVSLDIDVDVMISDLVPIGWLLQRLGRLWRFQHAWTGQERRPAWVRETGACLTVCHPVGPDGALDVPKHWSHIPAFTLHATAAVLAARTAGQPLLLPDAVPALVEEVQALLDTEKGAAVDAELHRAYTALVRAQEHLSSAQLIPPPHRVASLFDLHRQPLTAATAATRLGMLPRPLLPCYRTPHGRLALDAAGRFELPEGNLRPAHVRALLGRSVPVPAAWVARPGADHPRPPSAWRGHPLLGDLVLLPLTADRAPTAFGDHLLHLDPELGLVHQHTPAV
ncbi:HD domain-containing protein [Streptomyces sp. NBC_00433]